MRETVVEAYLRTCVERRGGTCEKFVSPGLRGVPDRMVSDRPGRIDFIETKAPKGRLAEHQKRDHARRRSRGFRVYTLYTKEMVDWYMRTQYGIP